MTKFNKLLKLANYLENKYANELTDELIEEPPKKEIEEKIDEFSGMIFNAVKFQITMTLAYLKRAVSIDELMKMVKQYAGKLNMVEAVLNKLIKEGHVSKVRNDSFIMDRDFADYICKTQDLGMIPEQVERWLK